MPNRDMLRVILISIIFIPFTVSAAENFDYSKISGRYVGVVFNGNDLDPVVTTFFVLPDGRLRGNYTVEDEVELLEGTISNTFNLEGQTYSLEWTDKYGEGNAVFVFSNDFSGFNGFWTNNTESNQFQWSGTKE